MTSRLALPFFRPFDPVRGALQRGAARLLALQRHDSGWDGAWRLYVGTTCDSTSTVGLAGLGLVAAYRQARDPAHLEAALRAAAFIAAHLGAGASKGAYHARFTASDVVFFHRLSQLTGEEAHSQRAVEEWRNIRSYFYFATADDLHRFFQKIERAVGAYDLAYYLEAAELCGDAAWADEAARILAHALDGPYCEARNEYRALNLAAAVRALAGQGYGGIYRAELDGLIKALTDVIDGDNVGGSVQDSAYAVMALFATGGPLRLVAGDIARWLAARLEPWGGWLEEGVQYPHVDAEALWALALWLGRRGHVDRNGTSSLHSRSSWAGSWRAISPHDPIAPFDGQ